MNWSRMSEVEFNQLLNSDGFEARGAGAHDGQQFAEFYSASAGVHFKKVLSSDGRQRFYKMVEGNPGRYVIHARGDNTGGGYRLFRDGELAPVVIEAMSPLDACCIYAEPHFACYWKGDINTAGTLGNPCKIVGIELYASPAEECDYFKD